ncbi:MAG: FHA domain-containing protein [Pirellulales bacterium]
MSNNPTPLRITDDDLKAPQVETYLETQAYLRRDVGAIGERSWAVKIIYANWFYLSLCCTVGGLVAWAITEPFFDDNADDTAATIAAIAIFPAVSGCVGLFLGTAEGLMCRNIPRAMMSGAVGLGVGFVGGLLALIPCGMVFSMMSEISFSLWDNPQAEEMPTGLALLVLMMGRGAAWSIAAIPAGIGQGIALREKKVIINGLVGAVLGGLLGGLLFDPISLIFLTDDGQAAASRAVGFATIGCLVGLFVGLVEGWTKTAWLLMQKGPLAGKQFILFKDTTMVGSVPKADIYLFKDDAIEAKHALIYNRGGSFEIEDCKTDDGTYVNGIPITRQTLRHGDQIVLGKTVLEFSVRESDASS